MREREEGVKGSEYLPLQLAPIASALMNLQFQTVQCLLGLCIPAALPFGAHAEQAGHYAEAIAKWQGERKKTTPISRYTRR